MVTVNLPEVLAKARRSFSAGGPNPTSVDVLGVEVTQAVQNMAHEVRLIAGKRTVVRVYLDPKGLTRNVRVRGEIVVSRTVGGPGVYVSSENEITLKATDHPPLKVQRTDAELSLNFAIPIPAAGALVIRVHRVIPLAGGDDVPINETNRNRSVIVDAGVPLRVRAVGLRYVDPTRTPPRSFTPDAIHFELLRSFMERAYPVSGLEWSQIVIPADRNFVPPFSGSLLPNGRDPLWEALLNIIHGFMARLRQSEVNAGRDPRTHYYGLVADDSGFFRGAANDVPINPNPAIVAVGPVGRPRGGLTWDDDPSYGDWYGAHEIGHTFGCRHPGFCNQNRDPRSTFPYEQGRLSNDAEDCIGFDVGDKKLNLKMRACPREHWHDVMTYCENQWVSKHTYDALYERLILEEQQLAPLTG
jgi:hypothetical protein